MPPKVSIITVNLNDRVGLRKTIESAVNQSFSDKEFIIVDGGSRDGSLDLIQEYAGQIDKWVCEPDRGIYDAMNKGISMSTGEWIIFMNSGDVFIRENVLERIFASKSFSKTDILYGNTVYINSERALKAPGCVNKKFFYSETLCHQSYFTHRKAFETIGEYSLHYRFISDREWLLRAQLAGLTFTPLDLDICEWDADGACRSNPEKYSAEIRKMRESYFTFTERMMLFVLNKTKNLLKRLAH